MYGCFWFETDSVKAAIDQMGPDCFLYESDFPHPTSMAPGPATITRSNLTRTSPRNSAISHPRLLRAVLHDNTAKLYHLD